MKKPKEVKEKRLTVKEKILRFVESKGSARFTDIQRFIVDDRVGEGTYDAGRRYEKFNVYDHKSGTSKLVERKVNVYRGVYCSSLQKGGHLRTGKQYIEKRENGRYYTVRVGIYKPFVKLRGWRPPDIRELRRASGIASTYSSFPTESVKEEFTGTGGCGLEAKKVIVDIEQHPNHSEVAYDSNGERFIGILKDDEPIFFHRTETKLSDYKGKLKVSLPDVPQYCRYCGHELDPSHFEVDNNGMTPNHCQWCGHIL